LLNKYSDQPLQLIAPEEQNPSKKQELELLQTSSALKVVLTG
jgi:hypothetical protein